MAKYRAAAVVNVYIRLDDVEAPSHREAMDLVEERCYEMGGDLDALFCFDAPMRGIRSTQYQDLVKEYIVEEDVGEDKEGPAHFYNSDGELILVARGVIA